MRARSVPVALACALACATGPALRTEAGAEARTALDRFTAAVEAGRWGEAFPLLSARWRARATPARLSADLAAAGPVGRDAVRRVRALLAAGATVAVTGDGAALAVGEGKTARLVREAGAWHVDALE